MLESATALLLSILLLPSLLLRYLPFAPFTTTWQKKRLALGYAVWFCVLFFFNWYALSQSGPSISIYKFNLLLGWLPYMLLNIYYIPHHLAHHLFVAGMQCLYVLLLHSISIFFITLFQPDQSLLKLYYVQSTVFLLLFTGTFPLIRRFFNRMFLSTHTFNDHAYWRSVCLLPLLIAADDMYLSAANTILARSLIVPRLILIPTFFVLIYAFSSDAEGLERRASLDANNKFLALQLSSLKEHTQVMEDTQRKMAVFRHDIRHYNHLLYTLIQGDKYEEALKLINSYDQEVAQTSVQIYCANPILNAALTLYAGRTEKAQIRFTPQVALPAALKIDENELAILLCNLLENALNASLKQPLDDREIRLQARLEKEHLFLALENRYQGKIKFDKNGLPVTSTAGHGLGMRSLSTFKTKYEAQVTCSLEKGWFRTLLLVKNQ